MEAIIEGNPGLLNCLKMAKLGKFSVVERIGSGAMGEVFRASTPRGESVAVKIIKPTGSIESEQQIDREVVSHARLLHPNLAVLLDIGTVAEDDEPPTGFRVGCTYLVMQLAHATLVEKLPLENWHDVKQVVLQILDGLAYAHARSVIHRDLKPSNVLIVEDEGERRAQIADFGISVIFDRAPGDKTAAELKAVTGTPAYMAPEQIHGAWHDYGPWTDLYALGCMVWEFVCGRPPYVGEDLFSTLRLHLDANLPAFRPMFPVPKGLRAWLVRALEPQVTKRFRRAADAARALDRLGEPAGESNRVVTVAADQQTRAWSRTLAPLLNREEQTDILDTLVDAGPDFSADPADEDFEFLFEARPEIPADWRPGHSANQVVRSPSLIGIRPPQFVGRERERDQIWRALREARENESVRVVVLSGRAGTGKTQLAEWLAHRGRELAVSGRLWAEFGDGGDGFGGLLRRTFYLWGVDEAAYRESIEHIVPPLDHDPHFETDIDALALIAQGRAGPDGELFWTMLRLLERLGRINLPTLFMNDIEDHLQALAFVDFLLSEADFPSLLLVSIDSSSEVDELFDRQLAEVCAHESVTRIDLEPLDEVEHRQFLDQMLELTPPATDRVVDLTLGSPLLAKELLVDWLEREILVEGPDGFELSQNAPDAVPETIFEVCYGRLERIVGANDSAETHEWRALELAAVWGQNMRLAALAQAEPAVDLEALVHRALRHGVAERTPVTFKFTNGLFRRALIRHAEQHGRLLTHHLRCAELIGETEDPRLLWRKSDHLIASGRDDEALKPLLEGARLAFRTGGVRAKMQFLNRRDRLVRRLGIPESDPAHLAGRIERAHCLMLSNSAEDPLSDLLKIDFDNAPELGAIVMRLASLQSAREGDFEEASRRSARAVEYAQQTGDEEELGSALLTHAGRVRLNGDLASAKAALESFDALRETSDFLKIARNITAASIHDSSGEPTVARELLEAAAARADQLRHHGLQQSCFNRLGNLERLAGNGRQARRFYAAQRNIVERVGPRIELAIIEFNFAMAALLDRDAEPARSVIQQAPEPDPYHDLRRLLALNVAILDDDLAASSSLLEEMTTSGGKAKGNDEGFLLDLAESNARESGASELADALKSLR